LLAGIAVLGAWCLIRGHVRATVAVAWRGLLCLIIVSAWADLTFTSVRIRGTQFLAGGFGGKWLAGSVGGCLRWCIAGLCCGLGGKWLADYAVAYLSRPGAYMLLGMLALGALCVGVKHPLLTALWNGLRTTLTALWCGLRTTGRWSWTLVRGVRQGLVWLGSV